MNAIYGLFPDADGAQRAVDLLTRAGVPPQSIAALSSEPFEEYGFAQTKTRGFMPWLAALGGLLGGVVGYVLVTQTQRLYPLATGGMPIAPVWTNGIITYEVAMLGAILTTLAVLLIAARLPKWWRWKRQLYDPAISDGLILIGVLEPGEELRAGVAANLRKAGAREVKYFGLKA